MLKIKIIDRNSKEMKDLDKKVPYNNIFRKVLKYVDFSFIYNEVRDLYSNIMGRPSVDPVILFKILFIQVIEGIKSVRKTFEKIEVDCSYRWFLGIPFGEKIPNHTLFSKNYQRKFKNSNVFENIFKNIIEQAKKYNLLDGTTFYTDSTHKKADANKNKFENKEVKVLKKRRLWVESEINIERKKQNKKEIKFNDQYETKNIKISITDPESGYYHRDNKEKGFMYLDHRTVDEKINLIVDCYITKGNVHDSAPYIERMEYLKKTFDFNIKKVALDSGYDTLDIKKYLIDNNIFGVIGYRRYGTTESRKEKSKLQYIENKDIYIDKTTGEILEYKGSINKQGYKKYINLDKSISTLRHIFQNLTVQFKNNRLSNEGKILYKKRKEKIERSFADSKQNHGYRYATYRGLEKNQNYTWLICAAQNIKNIVMKLSNSKY